MVIYPIEDTWLVSQRVSVIARCCSMTKCALTLVITPMYDVPNRLLQSRQEVHKLFFRGFPPFPKGLVRARQCLGRFQ